MKYKVAFILSGLVLASCSSNPNKVDTVRGEELSTDFVAEGIKVTSSGCGAVSKFFGRECVILSIDSTSTAPSNGGTVNNRKNAMDAACAYALANVRHWMGQRVESNRVVERISTSKEVSESKETQSSKGEGATSNSNRENENDTKVVVTNTVRQQARGFMEGWQPTNQSVVGAQEVSCTMSWSRGNTNLLKQVRAF